MKTFNKFWFKPAHQVKGKPTAEFELLPLSQRAYLNLQAAAIVKKGRVSFTPDGYFEVFDYAVQNWRGLEVEFSQDAKLAVIDGPADPDFAVWLGQITAELYRRVILGEPEVKNS